MQKLKQHLLLALLFLPSLGFAYEIPRDNTCPHADQILRGWARECSAVSMALTQLDQRLPEVEAGLSAQLNNIAQAEAQSVNIDQGAQCAHAANLNRAVAAYRELLGRTRADVDQIRWLIRDRIVRERQELLQNLSERAAAQDCAGATPCSRSAEGDRVLLGFLPQNLANRRGMENIRQEWSRVFDRGPAIARAWLERIRAWDDRVASYDQQISAILARNTCTAEGLAPRPEVAPVHEVDHAGSQPVLAAAETAAPGEAAQAGQAAVPGTPTEQPAQAAAIPTNGSAADRETQLREEARRASSMLFEQGLGDRGMMGSGFYVRVPDGQGGEQTSFLTANHVVTRNLRDPENTDFRRMNLYPGNTTSFDDSLENPDLASRGLGSPGSYLLNQQSTIFDWREDLVGRSAVSGQALALAPEGFVPQAGQEVLLAGYPVSNGGAYMSFRCSFQGYTSSITSAGMAYLIDCPTVDRNVGGMSGGPVIDLQSGQVIGLLSAGMNPASRNEVDRRLIIAPVYARQYGGVGAGLTPLTASPSVAEQLKWAKFLIPVALEFRRGYTRKLVPFQ